VAGERSYLGVRKQRVHAVQEIARLCDLSGFRGPAKVERGLYSSVGSNPTVSALRMAP
jgi:hypothetical protein